MKKVGIVTLFGSYNYGNRLQNYAVHQFLMKEGFYPETILWHRNVARELLKRIRCFGGFLMRKPKYIREYRFRKFDHKNIKTRVLFQSDGFLPQSLSREYDFFIVGSDQVWNPEVRRNEKDNYFLRFCRREQRIAISPSYAIDSMPVECETEYKIGLQGFPYLSCREKNGAQFISKLTHQKFY